MEKRKGKKAAAEKYEPIKGHFPGADFPLPVAQIDHTPMDVIVVDEEHRQPIQRPSLTVVIDEYSRMVLGFSIYLETPTAFTVGMAISHAIIAKGEFARWRRCSSRVALLGKDPHNPLRQREGISRHRNWS